MTTIAAIATPPGRGGVGVIRLSGPQALAIAMRLSASTSPLLPRVASLTSWLDEAGQQIDSGIALYFKAPASYTGEDVVELQAHGSPVILKVLLTRALALGAVPAAPGEFTRRAVENGKLDLSQAEAVAACIDAATERAARQAQKHLQGEFGRFVHQLMDELTGLVAHVEASLDFPEDEVPPLFFEQLKQRCDTSVVTPLLAAIRTATLGERLFDGATIAIVGAPNVGKSSLLNALAGRDRAIVSDIAGTTRDVLEVDFEIEGIPVRLADTAGLRISDDVIEQEGVRRARAAAEIADVVIHVADASRPDTWEPHVPVHLTVFNKADLAKHEASGDILVVSVKHGWGLDILRERLAGLLADGFLAGEEGLLVTRERHRHLLEQAARAVQSGLSMLGPEEHLDLVALQWRQAWSNLAELIGVGDVELILDRVFSDFCIGK